MQRLKRSHACIDCVRLGISISVPAVGDDGGRRIECVIAFFIEGNSFEAIFSFFDIRA